MLHHKAGNASYPIQTTSNTLVIDLSSRLVSFRMNVFQDSISCIAEYVQLSTPVGLSYVLPGSQSGHDMYIRVDHSHIDLSAIRKFEPLISHESPDGICTGIPRTFVDLQPNPFCQANPVLQLCSYDIGQFHQFLKCFLGSEGIPVFTCTFRNDDFGITEHGSHIRIPCLASPLCCKRFFLNLG